MNSICEKSELKSLTNCNAQTASNDAEINELTTVNTCFKFQKIL